jgi:hypothetical protein
MFRRAMRQRPASKEECGSPAGPLEVDRTRTLERRTLEGRVYTVHLAPLCVVEDRTGPAGPQILAKYQLGAITKSCIDLNVSES